MEMSPSYRLTIDGVQNSGTVLLARHGGSLLYKMVFIKLEAMLIRFNELG
jgi:hypothetical protein